MTTSRYKPRICVWEVTLACNAHCIHCGSHAGNPREDELDTHEAVDLIRSLKALGCESITLSGGEPLLRKDWSELTAVIHRAQMRPELITNGLLVADQADAIGRAGFLGVTFSVDGTASVHDALRGMPGSLSRLLKGAAVLREYGVRMGAVTQINRKNLGELHAIHDLLVENGFRGWQVQLTVPLGRAHQNQKDLLLAPKDLLTIESTLLAIRSRSKLFIQIADTIGYMGRGEPKLRSGNGQAAGFWGTCSAGVSAIGITSDGTVRGCLSMSPDFNEGNIRSRPLHEIWHDENAFSYNRKFSIKDLKGKCATCPLARFCRGGCTNLAFAATGDPTLQPYCLRQLYE